MASPAPRPPVGDAPVAPWPPPDLARIQGELWEIVRIGTLGSLILVLPLLWMVATEQEFWSLGPFGRSAWVPVVTTGVGLLLVLAAFRGLFRVLGRAAEAADREYGRLTLLEVVADQSRDTGFLAQGARHYGELDVEARNRLIRQRILSALAYLGATLWVPVGFAGGVLLAARAGEALSATTIWLVTLVPSAVLMVAGFVPRVLEERAVSAARARWNRRDGTAGAGAGDEIREWLERLGPSAATLGIDPGKPDRGLVLRSGAVIALVIFLFVAVPVLSLAFATTLGPQVADLAVPDFTGIREDAAATTALRRLRLEPDPRISAREAGEALNALAYVGSGPNAGGLLLAPSRTHAAPWFPEDPDLGALVPAAWVMDVLERARRGLDPAELHYLERLASHDGQIEMGILARAEQADVAGTRWKLPFPDTLTLLTLPVPSYRSVREGGYARVGKAAWELSQGKAGAAEESLREVVSAGLLLMDEGPVLADALAGMSLVNTGADGLEILYRVTGREEDAEGLRWARAAAGRAGALGLVGRPGRDVEGSVREVSAIVVDPEALRGLRWNAVGVFHTLSPCINLHKVVFGPGADYDAWLTRARDDLVRFSSEEELFRLARGGWLGSGADVAESDVLGRLLLASLGGSRGSGSCAALVAGASR